MRGLSQDAGGGDSGDEGNSLDKDKEQARLEMEMAKRRDRIEKWRAEKRKKELENAAAADTAAAKEEEEEKVVKKWSLEEDGDEEEEEEAGDAENKEGGGEVPGGEDERAQAHLGPPLQQRLLWHSRTRLQCLQCLHWPACGVSNTEREKHPVATRSRSCASEILNILLRS